MRTAPLHTLLRIELQRIYDTEKRLLRILPKMTRAAASDDLRSAFTVHEAEARKQIGRAEYLLDLAGAAVKPVASPGMKTLLLYCEEAVQNSNRTFVSDAALAAAARRPEHYQIAAYSFARGLAEQLSLIRVADLLQQSWEEKQEIDARLWHVARDLCAEFQSKPTWRSASAAGF
jgi:ferritin-like metal-binding protein YciE